MNILFVESTAVLCHFITQKRNSRILSQCNCIEWDVEHKFVCFSSWVRFVHVPIWCDTFRLLLKEIYQLKSIWESLWMISYFERRGGLTHNQMLTDVHRHLPHFNVRNVRAVSVMGIALHTLRIFPHIYCSFFKSFNLIWINISTETNDQRHT